MNDINQILTERGDRYGSFAGHANISQRLKSVIRLELSARKKVLSNDQSEALEMILHKIARIVNGDQDYEDSWRDIAGYSTLIADRLVGIER